MFDELKLVPLRGRKGAERAPEPEDRDEGEQARAGQDAQVEDIANGLYVGQVLIRRQLETGNGAPDIVKQYFAAYVGLFRARRVEPSLLHLCDLFFREGQIGRA